MNLEETKKIIQTKIEAEALTKNVRSQIRLYIHEKQNLRERFKETFQPLIESQDKTKESIDNQQNKLIKQLQENKLAPTEGLDKNRLAITQGLDKMDEVKKIKLLLGGEESDFTLDDEKLVEITEKQYDNIISQDKLDIDKYALDMVDPKKRILKVVKRDYGKEPEKGVVTFGDSDLNKGLLNKKSDDILKELKLPLPSKIKNRKHEDIEIFQNNAEVHLEYFRNLLSNKALFYTEKGVNKARAKSSNPHENTLRQIDYYNVLGLYISNISKLEN